jgi:hypothetical protein
VDIAYIDAQGDTNLMQQGCTRLRTFFLRESAAYKSDEDQVTVCGSHITVSKDSMRASEGMDAVQAPVIFRDQAP